MKQHEETRRKTWMAEPKKRWNNTFFMLDSNLIRKHNEFKRWQLKSTRSVVD